MNDTKESNESDEVLKFEKVTKVLCERVKEEGKFENELGTQLNS